MKQIFKDILKVSLFYFWLLLLTTIGFISYANISWPWSSLEYSGWQYMKYFEAMLTNTWCTSWNCVVKKTEKLVDLDCWDQVLQWFDSTWDIICINN